MISSDANSDPAPSHGFATTHWSVIVAARDQSAPQARQALATLCAAYWYPLYAYIRRQVHDADEAQDLTQEFFARLLEKGTLALVDSERGRFRSFLLAVCRHFLANERDRTRTQKRGGGHATVSLDFDHAEGRYGREPTHELTAERLFERQWALTLLEQVLHRLRQEWIDAGKETLFEQLKGFLTAEDNAGAQTQVAADRGMTAGAVKVAVHRLRRRYRELLRAEIGQTVHSPEAIDEEIQALFAALRS